MQKVKIDIALYAIYVAVAIMVVILAYIAKDSPEPADMIKPQIEKIYDVKVEPVKTAEAQIVYTPQVITLETADDTQTEPEADPEPDAGFTDAELAMLAGVVHAEAGNQDEIGRRLVADVVLNRLDDDRFPNTLAGVIMQDNQFGDPAGYTEADMAAVQKELGQRLDDTVLWFRTGYYHKYGVAMYQHGDHYFSGGG